MPETSAMTVIGPDTLFRGEMTFQSAARILGRFEGKITSPGQVEVGEGAQCKATIEAGTVVVDGLVEGDILARERLELNGTAQILGDITALKLVVAEGASFSGHCAVGPEAVKNAGAAPKAEAPAASLPAGTPRIARSTRPVESHGGDLDATLSGLEAKLASFGKARAAAE